MNMLFIGGGTLGSINPLIAVAQEVHARNPQLNVNFWTSSSALEQQVVAEAGFTSRAIIAGKFRRYFSLWTLIDCFAVVVAFFVACLRLIIQRPQVVLSAGSYVAVPVHIAAWLLRIPTITFQQDVQLGLANRIMASFATVRAVATPSRAVLFRKPTTVTGFALRKGLATGKAERIQQQYKLHLDWKTLLIIGGSSGAQNLNELVVRGLADYPKQLNIVHIVGQGKQLDAQRPGYVQIPFLNAALSDMYAVADLILCRAGSNILAEIVALRKPCIVVPLPGTHQERNAQEFAQAGVRILHEAQLTPLTLATNVLDTLADAHYMAGFPQRLRDTWPVAGAARLATITMQYV